MTVGRSWSDPLSRDAEFRKADREIARTADRILGEVDALFRKLRHGYVAHDYVVQRLGCEIIDRSPELLDWLNGIEGYCQRYELSVRLAEALADWRDDWSRR
jgi:hypothetical protein